jgi:stage V sporulation protein R
MVINNDPCYAYLLESNAEVDQKLVMAHVYGHCDFFKNNFSFANTNRKMMERDGEPRHARAPLDRPAGHLDQVEDFVDRALSLENLIDYHSYYMARRPAKDAAAAEEAQQPQVTGFKVDREYMRGFVNPQEYLEKERKKREEALAKAKKFPERPERDVLLFPAGERAAGALGVRPLVHRPRGGLLLRAAGPDQDHERGWPATGTPRSRPRRR